jgi:hypothetical protein
VYPPHGSNYIFGQKKGRVNAIFWARILSSVAKASGVLWQTRADGSNFPAVDTVSVNYLNEMPAVSVDHVAALTVALIIVD